MADHSAFSWRTIANLFPSGQRRKAAAEHRLKRAYQNLFRSEDGQIVLADLMNKSGWNKYCEAEHTTDRQLWQMEGRRSLFGDLFDHLSLSEADMRALENAARTEAAVDADPYEQE